MNYIVLALVGLVGVWLGFRMARRSGESIAVNKKRSAEKEERKEAITARVEEQGRITNDDVEEMFSVSDATATNYLQELEDEGLIEQMGSVGQSVYYRRVNG